LLATQLFNLTRGEGEDWAKAQVLGQGLEPDNPLYQPGGLPEDVRSSGEVVDQLNAVTQPYTAPAMLPAFQPAADATLDGTVDGGLDLDLELEAPAGRAPVHAAPSMPETTLPFTTSAEVGQDATLDLTLEAGESKTIPVRRNVAPPATPAADDMLDFDLGSLSTEPTTVALPRKPAPSAEPAGIDFGDFSIGGQPLAAGSEANDPLARKIELAEEFRQIGDMEGARDLLEEVVAKAEGAVKSKAQGMLDKLA
jgi:pilus assembly protein FimV